MAAGQARGGEHKARPTLGMMTSWPRKLKHTWPHGQECGQRDHESTARTSLALPSPCLSRVPGRGPGGPLNGTHLEPTFFLAPFSLKPGGAPWTHTPQSRSPESRGAAPSSDEVPMLHCIDSHHLCEQESDKHGGSFRNSSFSL